MLPKIWYGGKFFFVGYAYDGHGPQNQLWTCSRGFHVRQRCCPKYGTSQKFCIVPFWLVGRPSAGILLPKNFVLFPFGVSFWLVGQPSAGLLLPQNLVRGLNFFLSFPVKSLREPRSRPAAFGVSCPAAMAPKMLNVVNFFLWAMLMMGMDLENGI